MRCLRKVLTARASRTASHTAARTSPPAARLRCARPAASAGIVLGARSDGQSRRPWRPAAVPLLGLGVWLTSPTHPAFICRSMLCGRYLRKVLSAQQQPTPPCLHGAPLQTAVAMPRADDKRDELDAIVARTSAFINLIATIPPTSDCLSAARALTQDTPPSSTPGSAAAAAAKGGPREALVVMCGAAVQRAGTMAAGVSFETHEAAWEGLCRLRAEGLKLLAEFTALSVQHAAFLAMCLEGGDAAAAELDFSAGAHPSPLRALELPSPGVLYVHTWGVHATKH